MAAERTPVHVRKVAVDAHNKKVDAYSDPRNADNPLPDPGDFADPSKDERQRAQAILKAARSARNRIRHTAFIPNHSRGAPP